MTKSTDLAMRPSLIDELIAAGRDFYSFGWVPGISGNFSFRLGDNALTITTSESAKRALTHESFVDVDLDGQVLDKASGAPSRDLALHLAIYQNAPDSRAVLHIHHLGAALCSDRDHKAGFTHFHELEILRLLGVKEPEDQVNIPILDNLADRKEMAELIAKALKSKDLKLPCVNIKNHGIYVWGATLAEARHNLEACAYLFDYSRVRPMHPARGGTVSGFRI